MCAPPQVMARLGDGELIAGLERRDPCSLAEVDRRHRPALRAHAGRLLAGTGLDAEDVVQDALLRAWTSPPREGRPLAAWLQLVTRNRGLDLLRSAAVRQTAAPVPGVDPPAPRDAYAEVRDRERLRAVVDAVRTLPERQSRALVLHAMEGRPHSHVARALGTSERGAKALLHRARRQLARVSR